MAGKLYNFAGSLGGGTPKYPPGMDPAQVAATQARHEGVRGDRGSAWIATGRIQPDPDQPRTEFDEEALERLAASLKERGQLQPIRVRWDEGRGAYVVLVGERRWRAAVRSGLPEMRCVIHDGPLSDDERLSIQLVENALREDLKPVEQARAYKRLIEAKGWSSTDLARELQVHQTTVGRALALLDLPCTVQDRVEEGALAPSVAYEIGKLDRPEDQAAVAEAVEKSGLSRSEVADLVQAVRARRPAPAAKPEPRTFDLGEVIVTVRWKKAGTITAAQALQRAARQAREQDQDERAA